MTAIRGQEQDCVFCPDSGKVTMIDRTPVAYLAKAHSQPAGRYLIIPKHHITDLRELPTNWTLHQSALLGTSYGEASDDLKMSEDDLSDRLNLSWNQGTWAGQTIKHIHLWVVFRTDTLKRGLGGLIDYTTELECEVSDLKSEVTGLQSELAAVRRDAGLQLNG